MVRGILRLFKSKNSHNAQRRPRTTFSAPSEAAAEEYRPTMFRTPKPSFRATVEDASDEDAMTLTSSMMEGTNLYPTARRAASTAPPLQTVPSSQVQDRVTVISLPDHSYQGSLLTAGQFDRSHHMNDYGAPSVAGSTRGEQAHYRTRDRPPKEEYAAPSRFSDSGEQYAPSEADDRAYAESEAPSLLRAGPSAVPLPGLHDPGHRSDSRGAPSLSYPRSDNEYSRSQRRRPQHGYAEPPLSTTSGENHSRHQANDNAYGRAGPLSTASRDRYPQHPATNSAYARAPATSVAQGEYYAQHQANDNAYGRAAPLSTASGEHYAQHQMNDPSYDAAPVLSRAGTSTFPQPLPDSPGSEGQAAYAHEAAPSVVGSQRQSEHSMSWSRSAVFVPRPGSPVDVADYRVRVEDPRPSSRSTHHTSYRDDRPDSRTSHRSRDTHQSRRSNGNESRRYNRGRDRDRSPSPESSRYHSRSPCDCSSCRRRDHPDSGPKKPYVTFEGNRLVVHVNPGSSVKVGNPTEGYLPVDEYNARQRARAAMAAQQPLYAVVPAGQVPGYPLPPQQTIMPQMIVPSSAPLYTLSPVYPGPPMGRPMMPTLA